MAINKESNGFTFGFAILLVVVVGTVLALLAMGLKPMVLAGHHRRRRAAQGRSARVGVTRSGSATTPPPRPASGGRRPRPTCPGRRGRGSC